MSWVAYALLGAAIGGIVAIIDSHLLSRRFPGLLSYLMPLGIFHFSAGVIILILQPFPAHPTVLSLSMAFSTGIIGGLGTVITLNLMRNGEVSRIIPVVSTSPIFVALLAMPFFNESLGYRDWLGIIITIAGAFLISLEKGAGGQKTKLQKSFLLMVLVSILYALSTLATKYALGSLSFWNLYSANAIGFGAVFFIWSARPVAFRQVKQLPFRNRVLALIVAAQSVVIVAIIFGNIAIQRGSVSIASTLGSVRPAFVFVFALILSRFFPQIMNEPINRSIILIKVSAIAMIIGGVALLTL